MKYRPLFSCRNQRGLSLLESALALAVLGLVIAGVWTLSAGAFGSTKKNRLAEQVIATVEGVRAYVRNTDLDTLQLNTQNLWDLGLLPNDVRRSGGFRHPYGGSFGVAATRNNLYITLGPSLPSEACVDLIYARLGGGARTAEDFGLIGWAPSAASGPTVFTFDFDTATSNCANNNGMMLAFTPR